MYIYCTIWLTFSDDVVTTFVFISFFSNCLLSFIHAALKYKRWETKFWAYTVQTLSILTSVHYIIMLPNYFFYNNSQLKISLSTCLSSSKETCKSVPQVSRPNKVPKGPAMKQKCRLFICLSVLFFSFK